MIKVKIDVMKIDKNKLFKGEKGTYLDMVLIPTPDSKYDQDFMVVQDTGSRDEKGAILGNGKHLKKKDAEPERAEIIDDGLPF